MGIWQRFCFWIPCKSMYHARTFISWYNHLKATLHTRLKACDCCILKSLISWKGWDHPSSFHTRRWRSKDIQHGWKVCFMICWDPRQVHLQEVGLTQILANHVKVKASNHRYGLWIRVNGHGSWLVCEVALSLDMIQNSIDLNNNLSRQRFSHLDIPTKYQYLTRITILMPPKKFVFMPLVMLIIDIMQSPAQVTRPTLV